MSTLTRHHGGGVILITILIGLVLSILPLPERLELFRPDWTLLILLYWSLALPQRIGVGIAWITGLLQGVLTATLLGQHAMAYAIVSYLIVKLHQRLRLHPLWQQSLSILILLYPKPVQSPSFIRTTYERHRDIIKALREGDQDLCEKLICEDVEMTKEMLNT